MGIFCSLLASVGWDVIIEKNSNLLNKTHILNSENPPNYRAGARGVHLLVSRLIFSKVRVSMAISPFLTNRKSWA